MPLSEEDSERLERVYQQAASIRLARRMRLLALAVPVLLVGGGLVLAAPDDSSKLQIAAATTTTSVVDDAPELVPSTTLPTTPTTAPAPPQTVPPTSTTVTVPPAPTTTTSAPRPENCGGSFGQTDPPQPPAGMEVTTEASPKTVRRGDVVTLTVRARWTGSQPYTHERGGRAHLLYAHLNGEIFYSNQYDPNVGHNAFAGDETFAPGEVKSYTVQWDTSQSCGPNGMSDATLRTGNYTVAATWDSTSGTWTAKPFSFEITA